MEQDPLESVLLFRWYSETVLITNVLRTHEVLGSSPSPSKAKRNNPDHKADHKTVGTCVSGKVKGWGHGSGRKRGRRDPL